MRGSTDVANVRVLAIAGSIRRDSFNRRLLHAVAQLAPRGLSIEVYDGLDAVPLFNEDIESPHAPPGVEHLRAAVAIADGLLIATPEYNQALPGVVKNFVDWLSRGDVSVLEGKPTAILGVTTGRLGHAPRASKPAPYPRGLRRTGHASSADLLARCRSTF
jgi:chromate reductase